MTCAICQRDANDNSVAYYSVMTHDRPEAHDNPTERLVWTCWLCLPGEEKAARIPDIGTTERIFKAGNKTIKEMTL